MGRQPWDAFSRISKCAIPLLFGLMAGCGSGNGGTTKATMNFPAINGTPATQIQVGQAYSFTPVTSDPGNLVLGFSVQNKPSWAMFSVGTGQLSGTPAAGDIGSYANVTISVTNGQSMAALPTFSIAVLPQNSGTATQHSGTATLSWAAPTSTTTGAALINLAGYTITYGSSSASLDQTVSLTDPSTTTYTVQNLTAGTWYFTVAAYTSDGLQSSPSNVASLAIQ